MSDAEVEYLRSAYEPHLCPCPFSLRIPFTGLAIGGRVCDEIQYSFPKADHRLLGEVEGRMLSLIPDVLQAGLRNNDRVHFQIVRYAPNQGFAGHFDIEGGPLEEGKHGSEEDQERTVEVGAPMPMTFMVYLTDMETGAGGSTEFLTNGDDWDSHDASVVSISPRKGDMLIWTTCTPNGTIDKRTYHRGEFLKHGEKWILNRFFLHSIDIDLKHCRNGLKPRDTLRGDYYL